MRKHIILFNLLALLFMCFSARAEKSNCGVFNWSDIHLYSGELNKPEESRSLNYQFYKKGMEEIKKKMVQAAMQDNMDCLSFVINGDPYNRSKDSKVPDRPGFEKDVDDKLRSISDREQLIVDVAEDIKKRLFEGKNCQQSEKPGEYLCEITSGDKKKNITVFLGSNIGDHEIPKMPAITDVSKFEDVVKELPTSPRKRVEERLKSMEGGKPKDLDQFHTILKEEAGISVTPDPAFYKWKNGDDVQLVNSVGQKIAGAWRSAGFYTPSDADPRRGHLIVMPDGKCYVFSHVDKIASEDEERFMASFHEKQGHERKFTGSFYRGYPEDDIRYDSRVKDCTVITGDSHVARFSMNLGILATGDKNAEKVARTVKRLTNSTDAINCGTFSSPLRQTNGLNGFCFIDPQGKSEIFGLNMGKEGNDDSGYAYSNKYIGNWLGAKTAEDRLLAEKKMKEDLQNAKFVSDNPNMHHQGGLISTLLKTEGDQQKIMRILKDYGVSLATDNFDKIKYILSCHRPGKDLAELMFESEEKMAKKNKSKHLRSSSIDHLFNTPN